MVTTAQEVFTETVRALTPTERLRLAALILQDLAQTEVAVVVPDFEPDARGKTFNLAEIVARMPSDYQPGEESFGAPVGKEEW